MIVACVDTETTGPDPKTAQPLEVAIVIKEIGRSRPLWAQSTFVCPTLALRGMEVPAEASAVHGITSELLERYAGPDADTCFDELDQICDDFKVDYLVAHNAAYDREVIARDSEEGAKFAARPWICTLDDCPHDGVPSRKLGHLAADRGFVNPFPHTALADCMTTLRILESFDLDIVLKRAQSPTIYVRAIVDYDNRELAKKQRFLWEQVDGKIFPKWWVKRIKECDLEALKAAAGFPIMRVNND